MTPAEKEDLDAAMAEIRAAPGIFYLGLRKPDGGDLWTASVAHDEVRDDRIIHGNDPAVFDASHADAASALRIAAEKAMTALREPPRLG